MIQTNFIDMENMFDLLKEKAEVSEAGGLGGVCGEVGAHMVFLVSGEYQICNGNMPGSHSPR